MSSFRHELFPWGFASCRLAGGLSGAGHWIGEDEGDNRAGAGQSYISSENVGDQVLLGMSRGRAVHDYESAIQLCNFIFHPTPLN